MKYLSGSLNWQLTFWTSSLLPMYDTKCFQSCLCVCLCFCLPVCLPVQGITFEPVSIEPLDFKFQVQHSPFWANLACAAWEIFKLLFMHHLILVRINRARLHKESLSLVSKCHVSQERRDLDLDSESEVQGLNAHWGVIFCHWNFRKSTSIMMTFVRHSKFEVAHKCLWSTPRPFPLPLRTISLVCLGICSIFW